MDIVLHQDTPERDAIRLMQAGCSQTETALHLFVRISQFGTPNVIPLTQIEMAVYFSCIFSYLYWGGAKAVLF
jgi:hypothetical protein